MKFIGAHVSASGGVENAPLNAKELNATAFALFTKNQRQWTAKPLTAESINAFKENLSEAGIEAEYVLPHDSYLINLGNPNDEKRQKSLDSFVHELQRVEQLGLKMLNFHPGGHMKEATDDECLQLVADSMNEAIAATESAVLVIEGTAGQGSWIGYKFEHLAKLIELTHNKDRVGVCLDTCHMFAAGYDIRTEDTFSKTFAKFDALVGFQWLRGMHLNDAKSELGSRVDRHDSLGAGNIGWDAFRLIMEDSRFDNIPLVLETPNVELWEQEIMQLKSFSVH